MIQNTLHKIRRLALSVWFTVWYGRTYEQEQQMLEKAQQRSSDTAIQFKGESNSTDNTETSASAATRTIELRAGGRVWEGTPEEFEALKERLNEVVFRD
jgi:hypothetical protein